MKVFEVLLDSIPDNSVLHMGNSTVVRYIQLFNHNPNINYYVNRGVSGIDGCTSTALGFALNSVRNNILITGDISFHYDINAFWHKHLPEYFRLIIINNGGGGIFRIIPGPSSTSQLEEYFEAHQNMDASLIAAHYNLQYFRANNLDELKSLSRSFFDDSKVVKVLEIFTPREQNDLVLAEYFKDIHNQ